jgi:hypothetical protein
MARTNMKLTQQMKRPVPASQTKPFLSFCLSVRPYQAAVALSNMGVTMVERQMYNDAVITIRDALYIIRAFADPERDIDVEKTNALPTNDDIQYMIQRATNCLVTDRLISGESSTHRNVKIKTLSDQYGSILDTFRAVNEANLFLVRISDTFDDIEDFSTSYDIHYKASAILLNYGTACQCLHYGYRNNGNGSNMAGTISLLQESLLFLKISHRILTRQIEQTGLLDCVPQIKPSLEWEAMRTLNLTALVLQSLINICHVVGESDELCFYRYKFDSVCQAVARAQRAQWWNFNETAPSA